jgi:hypothetical protein
MSDVILYASAVNRGRTAWNATSKSAWTLAEIAANVETKYAENTLVKLAAAIAGDDLSGATLANYRTVWLAYVTDESDTRDVKNSNSFTVHEKFAKLPDRVKLLASKHWSASEARAYVKALNAPEPGEDEVDGEGAGESAGAGAESPNRRDWLVNKIAETEAKLLKWYTELSEIDAADDTDSTDADSAGTTPAAPVLHIVGGGVPEHDASAPHAACPVCKDLGIAPAVTEQAGSPRRARRNRRQPAAA